MPESNGGMAMPENPAREQTQAPAVRTTWRRDLTVGAVAITWAGVVALTVLTSLELVPGSFTGLSMTAAVMVSLLAWGAKTRQLHAEQFDQVRAELAELRDRVYDLGFADGFESGSGGRGARVTRLPGTRTGSDGSPS
jgi:hypothetical protein